MSRTLGSRGEAPAGSEAPTIVGALALWLQLGPPCADKKEHKSKEIKLHIDSDAAKAARDGWVETVRGLPNGPTLLERDPR